MNRFLPIVVVFLGTLIPTMRAQTAFDRTVDRSLWLDGRNMGGARIDYPTKVSYAEAGGGIASGDFKAPDDASSSWNAGAEAKTLVNYGKFSTLGTFSFGQKQGDGMDGSMFINPGRYPVDVHEFTPGKKTLQTYSFTGGLAVPLDRRWTVGGRMGFEGANYAKRKDIRHTNYRLDLTVSPSVALNLGPWTFGASWVLSKESESIQAEQIGTATAESYYAFLDKGLMFGTSQVWNGSGIHLAEAGVDRFAVKEIKNGGALQVSRSFQGGEAYADAEYLFTSGEVGEKSYTYYRFPGALLTARAGLRLHTLRGDNLFRLGYSWKKVDNDEYVIDKVSSGGVVNPVTYGHNRVFSSRELNLSPEWTFYGEGAMSWLYRAHLEAGWNRKRQLSTLMYPYSHEYSTDILGCSASAEFRLKAFRLGAGFGWMKGMPEEKASAGNVPVRQAGLWDLKAEWENASRAGADLSLRWDLPFRAMHGIYVRASGSFLKGFGVVHAKGDSRMEGALKIGYEF